MGDFLTHFLPSCKQRPFCKGPNVTEKNLLSGSEFFLLRVDSDCEAEAKQCNSVATTEEYRACHSLLQQQ